MTPATLRATEPSVTRPCLRRSSGTKAMPARIAARGLCAETGRPPRRTLPGVVLVDAEDGAGDLAAAGADEAGEADDLAGADREADVVEDPGTLEALDLEDDVADRRPASSGRARRPRGRPSGETICGTVVSATRSVEM